MGWSGVCYVILCLDNDIANSTVRSVVDDDIAAETSLVTPVVKTGFQPSRRQASVIRRHSSPSIMSVQCPTDQKHGPGITSASIMFHSSTVERCFMCIWARRLQSCTRGMYKSRHRALCLRRRYLAATMMVTFYIGAYRTKEEEEVPKVVRTNVCCIWHVGLAFLSKVVLPSTLLSNRCEI